MVEEGEVEEVYEDLEVGVEEEALVSEQVLVLEVLNHLVKVGVLASIFHQQLNRRRYTFDFSC